MFKTRCLGEVSYYLGLEVKRKNNIYSINQQKFINKILNSYGLSEAKIMKILIDSAHDKNQQDQPPLPSNQQFQSLIGSLWYVALNTRPDISSSVAILSQKTSKPSEYDWNQLKQIVRYLKGTINYKPQVPRRW